MNFDENLTLNRDITIKSQGDNIFKIEAVDGMTTNFPLITTSDKKLTLSNVKINGFKNIVRNAGALGVDEGSVVNILNSSFYDNTSRTAGAIDVNGTIENITNSTFDKNFASYYGGAININGTSGNIIKISGSTFKNNYTDGSGGAIYNSGKIGTIENSTFEKNESRKQGAVTNASGATIGDIISSKFISNSTSENGGAIANGGASINSIKGSSFTGNTASYYGGAIWNGSAIDSITGSTFTGNKADNSGGAIYNNGTIKQISSEFYTNGTNNSNDQLSGGGAIHNSNKIETISDSIFSGNTAPVSGGAIFNYAGKIGNIKDSQFLNNQSNAFGGAIYNFGTISTLSSIFNGNTASTDGGAIYNITEVSNIAGSSFTDNTAGSSGGAIRNENRMNSITATFENNKANGTDANSGGGAIFNNGRIRNIENSTFTNNTANYGGAIYNSRNIEKITDTSFTGNSAIQGSAIHNIATIETLSAIFENNKTDGAIMYVGGTVYNGQDATIQNITKSTFTGNTTTRYGSAILNNGGKIESITDSDFVNNVADFNGGAIFNRGTINTLNATFSGNTGHTGGGAIYNFGSIGTITSTFENNKATEMSSNNGGGAIINWRTISSITGSTFSNNTAGGYGGAIVNYKGTIESITDSTFSGNTVGDYGGAIFNNDGTKILSLTASSFSGNIAANRGGAIWNNGTIETLSATFENNKTTGYLLSYDGGGAIYNDLMGIINLVADAADSTDELLDEVLFSGNIASLNRGDAIYNNGGGTISFTANNRGAFTFLDNIYNDGTIDFAGDGTGKFNLFNDIKGNGTLNFNTAYDFNMANSEISKISAATININASSALSIDADLSSAGRIDEFYGTVNVADSANLFTLNNINFLHDMDSNVHGMKLTYSHGGQLTVADTIVKTLTTSGGVYEYTNDGQSINVVRISNEGGFSKFVSGIHNLGAERQYSFTENENMELILGNSSNKTGLVHHDNANLTIFGNGYTLTGVADQNYGSGGALVLTNAAQKATVDNLIISGFNMAALSNGGELVVKNSTFKNNNTIIESYGKTTLENSIFEENNSNSYLFYNIENNDSELTISGSFVRNNNLSNNSIMIAENNTTTNIAGTLFENNTITTDDGNNYNIIEIWGYEDNPAILNISGSAFQNNKSDSGSIIRVFGEDDKVTISGSKFLNNETYNGLIWNHSEDLSNGGAIEQFIGGTIEISNSLFEGNKSTDSNGIIFNETGGNITISESIFKNNSVSDGHSGGAILNVGSLTITNSFFEGNSADYGGAIDSFLGTIEITNASFVNNSAAGKGGAIYNEAGTINFTADENGGVLFKDNTADSGTGNGIYNAGDLTFTANSNGTFVFYDDIYNTEIFALGRIVGTMTFEGDGTGTFYMLNDIRGTGNITFNNDYAFNMLNDTINVIEASNLTINSVINMAVDVDLANATMDHFDVTNIAFGENGKIIINNMNLISEATADRTIIPFITAGTNNTAVSSAISKIDTGSLTYYYNVSYADGNFTFDKMQRESNEVAEDVGIPAVSAGVQQMQTSLNSLLANRNIYLNMGLASGDTTRPTTWAKAFGSKDSVELKNSYNSIDTQFYGVVGGIDSRTFIYDNGINAVYGIYAAYMGSNQKQNSVKVTQDGGYLGVSADFTRNGVFSRFTAHGGYIANEAKTAWGNDKFDIWTASVSNKTGYEIDLGEYTLKPALYASYMYINTENYTSKAGAKLKNHTKNVFEVTPEVKLAKDFGAGLEGYAKVAYTWNFYQGGKVTADDVLLPKMSVKPYVEYGVGLEKDWSEEEWNPKDITSYAEINRHDGGRTGWDINAGLKFQF